MFQYGTNVVFFPTNSLGKETSTNIPEDLIYPNDRILLETFVAEVPEQKSVSQTH